MDLLTVKLIVTPLLILACSLAERRWGAAVGGWLVGLPLSSGPVAVFLALEQGPPFVAQSSGGSLGGVVAQCAFSLVYAAAARRGWPVALGAASLAFAAVAALMQSLQIAHLVLMILAFLSLALTYRALSGAAAARTATARPWWDIPARMAVVSALVVTLTSLAEALGPRATGIIATYPIFATVLTVFAHRSQGAHAAIAVLRGMAAGLFGFVLFFYALGQIITETTLPLAFAAATVCALALQGASLKVLQRKPAG